MNTPGKTRPSLLSGQGAAAGNGRILADIDGRAVRLPPPAGRKGARKWLVPAVLLASLLLVVLAIMATMSRDDGTAAIADGFKPLPAESDKVADRGAAMIVDEPQARTAAAPPDTAMPRPVAGAAGVAATVEPVRPATAAPRQAPPGRAAAPRPAGTPDRARPAEQGALLSSLLGIIKQDEQARPKRPESMDALVADIQARESRERAERDAMFDAMDKRSSGDSAVQAKLARCPAANTLKGVDCRRRICAAVAGRDPACPKS
jgi:hypothetical protein